MYRRFKGTELWHLNAGCVSWPLLNFEEKDNPAIGKVCGECLELEQMVTRRPRADTSNRDSTDTLPS